MKTGFLLILSGLLCVLTSCGNGGLPEEAKAALDAVMLESYQIEAAQQGRAAQLPGYNPGFTAQVEELWCVITDRPDFKRMVLLWRIGLSWQATVTFTNDPNGYAGFRMNGCSIG